MLVTIAGTGCSDSSIKSAAPPVASKQAQKVVSAPSATAVESNQEVYVYNPAGRRDPFAPIIVRATAPGPKLTDRPPLERYNVYEFKLTGIIWGGFGYNAMVEGPDGKGYFVRPGTAIGLNRGTVKKITQDTMVVEEKYKTYSGETDFKEIIIELRKKQEGTP